MVKENIKRAIEIIDRLSKNEMIKSSCIRLQKELLISSEKFVWKTLTEHLEVHDLESEFKSAWMFVIRKNTASDAHFHPNSTQYTAIIDGEGTCEIDGIKNSLQKFDTLKAESLYVINKGVSHEFFPGDKDLVVISLHTVIAEDLIEVNALRGSERNYE